MKHVFQSNISDNEPTSQKYKFKLQIYQHLSIKR
jgi:hypothetical protein